MLYMNIKKLRKITLFLAIATHHVVSVSAHQMLLHRVTYLSDTMERYDTLVIASIYGLYAYYNISSMHTRFQRYQWCAFT